MAVHLDEALAGAQVRPETAAVLRGLFAPPAADDGAAWARVLHEHLVRICRIAHARGVRVVLLGYPFARPALEDVQRAVAAELRVPFVNVREHFDRLLQTRARDELFVRDGHCTDAGYDAVAALAAPAVAAALRQ
jgi:hypothetical protein